MRVSKQMFLIIALMSFNFAANSYKSMDVRLAEAAKGEVGKEKATDAILDADKKENNLVQPSSLALGKFSLTSPDINVFFKARLREEYMGLYDAITFRSDYPDDLDMVRQKFSLYFYAIQGLQQYGKASTEAFFKLTSYNFWQNEGYYVNMSEENIYMNEREPDKEVRFMDDHKHTMLVPMVFLEDVWFKINFGTFNKLLENHSPDLKMGYFEYILGRGLTLGSYYDVGVEHLGWRGQGGAIRFPQSPPGALFSLRLFETTTLDIYYSQWTETNNYPTQPLQMLNTQLLKERGDNRDANATGRTWRGKTKDQQSWSARINYDKESKKWGKLSLQPYIMWTRAPEQMIEIPTDASSKFGTVGAMADWQHKGWRFNIEGAFQFGHQDVHAIDRNVIEVERDHLTGDMKKVYSNIFVQSSYSPQKAPVTDDLRDLINEPEYMGINKNGVQVGTVPFPLSIGSPTGSETYVTLPVYNANVLGAERFRKPFKINYEGFMAMADLSYECEKFHLKPAIMAAYISGDNYPYNYPYNDRNYTGFLTLRDQNYMGLEVLSYAMLEARFIPRPLNMAYHKAYAYNHYNDASNLAMFGAGLIWHPYKNKEKLFFQFNAIGFWSTKSMYKWNKDEVVSFDGIIDDPVHRGANEAVWTVAMHQLHVEGWQTEHKASSYLGTELNARWEMHFQNSLEWLIRGAIFLTGDTYKDLYGQPNRNTRRLDYKGSKYYESLGTSNAWGIHSSLTYRF